MLKVSDIVLQYSCDNCGGEYAQPLADIVEVGTLICPDCGEDMALAESVALARSVSAVAGDMCIAGNIPHILWSREDILSESSGYSEEDAERIADVVEQSSAWRTDMEDVGVVKGWEVLNAAIYDAVEELGVNSR